MIHLASFEFITCVLYCCLSKVDRSSGSTVTVMKRLKFTATARFVRLLFPPFQHPGGEQPTYKVGLYGCSDKGKTKGKAMKGKGKK